ncbi:hypothetical protein AKJ09_03350 [Labilithrix luteola]|uniref:Tetratricopeptide repeat protein n=1 Tax=Labilithrix luteola TaxID=1391654 RepID=A0A0K1PTI1_9BACT|nr:hypothetical protein AKJ09_03350 [Labilithrix luteola]
MDWQRLVYEAMCATEEGGLSEQDGKALEARVLADANDVDARVRLVGFYLGGLSPERHRRRAEHVAWLAEHRPDIGLSGFGYIEEEQTPEGHEAIRRAWVAVAAQPDAKVHILENAATFLGVNHPAEAEALFRRALAMDPENGSWRKRIAHTLTNRATRAKWTGDSSERRRYARAAIEELEVALDLSQEDWCALGIRIDLTRAAVLAEDWVRVRETAERVLVDNETCWRTYLYGNAIHWANIALGFAALADDQLTAASSYLVRAGKTPGSPQLNSFGPDRELARALLARGERTAVSTYLEDCARFWAGEEAHLTGWRTAIERGEPTKLELPEESDDA